MLAEIKRWGNSYAIRVSRAEVEKLGLREGAQVRVRIEKLPSGPIDLSGLPTVRDRDRRASEHLDRYLYGGQR
jgi:antitoxin component of MazEF toxin-antitoxin module